MKKSALALSGGGVLGVAHLGFLETLWDDYEFDMYAGVSAGAIVSACLALGKTPKEVWDIIHDTKIFKVLFDISPRNFGLFSGEKVYKILGEIFEDAQFEDTKYPLFIGATDFSTGKRLVINTGSIADAVRASISVPIVFEPYFHKELEKWLVDGGLSQNLPLDTVLEKYKGEHIIGIDVGSDIDPTEDFSKKEFFAKGKHLTEALIRTFRIFYKNQQHFIEDPRVQIIRPKLAKYSAADVLKLKEIYKVGEESGKAFLKK